MARRTDDRFTDPETGTTGQDHTAAFVTGRIGLRRYGAAPTGLRPLIGLGVTGTFQSSEPGRDSWALGPYGEIGASWFFTPHVSLGAAGQLSAGYRQILSSPDIEEWYVRLGPVRLLGAVYF